MLGETLTAEYRNFRICLCLEVSSRPQEATQYCQKAASVCKERIHRLKDEVKSLPESISSASESDNSIADKKAEINTLSGLSSELEKKVGSVNSWKIFNILFCCSFDIKFMNLLNICSLKICNS